MATMLSPVVPPCEVPTGSCDHRSAAQVEGIVSIQAIQGLGAAEFFRSLDQQHMVDPTASPEPIEGPRASASNGPASEEAGWKVLGRNGKSCHAVLFLFAKEIYVFVISVVPEDSKGVITLSEECKE
ncbi:hypothetical protein HGM15179_009050 [Zosterops borbonicus]|uniref:Uncharacterized protein n=1 Tax=Zosterops borbonicus TaxID=364589 RepID=A0A8K1LLC5_9PASS|nr:hypothetical protein HGM15179_009050 [Zosterops borbonicus]